MRSKPLTGHLGALLALLLVASAFWIHRMHGERPDAHHFLGNGDLYAYHYPTAVFIHNELRSGAIPLWNPYQLAGQPFAALHVTSGLYPPHLALLALARPERALELGVVLHLVIAGFFTWLFAARLGLAPPARIAAALAYMFCAPTLVGIYQVPYLFTQVWLPAILWSLHGLVSEARPRWAVALSAALSLSFLGGHAQGFLYEVQLAAGYGLFALATVTPRGARFRVLGLVLVAGLLTVGFSAPQLLPTLELVGDAVRGLDGISYEEAAAGALPGDVVARGVLGFPFAETRGRQVVWPLLGLPLVLCGWLATSQRPTWFFFLVATLVAGLFIVGAGSPVFALYYALPLGDVFRVPGRMAFLYLFLASMLVAIGVEGVSERLARLGWRRAQSLVVSALVLVIAVDAYGRSRLSYAHPALASEDVAADGYGPPRLVAADGYGPPRLVAADGYGPPRLVATLKGRPDFARVFIENGISLQNPDLQLKAGQMNGFFAVPDYEPTILSAYERYFGARRPLWHGGVSLLPQGRVREPEELLRLLDLMSVRYYTSGSPKPWRGRQRETLLELTGGALIEGKQVIERREALPRTYVVRCVRTAADVEAAIELLHGSAFRPRVEAIVTSADSAGTARLAACSEAGTLLDTARIVGYESDRVTIEATCGAACLLILTDLHYPGWRAYVDGREQPVLPVNGLFRGVVLDPGEHGVVYRFEPGSFRLGVWLALACALTSLAYGALRAGLAF